MNAAERLPETLTPIVLVGGRSRRFGRDKLVEPVDGEPMAARPIATLRAVFGGRVVAVGACDEGVAGLADGHVVERSAWAGRGPMGGIAEGLARFGAVFVLAGDMPWTTAAAVRRVAETAGTNPHAWAVLGSERGEVQPCMGVYRGGMLAVLEERLAAGEFGLTRAIPAERLARVEVDGRTLTNINEPGDLRCGDGTKR